MSMPEKLAKSTNRMDIIKNRSSVNLALLGDVFLLCDAHPNQKFLNPVAVVSRQLDERLLLVLVALRICLLLLLLDAATAFKFLDKPCCTFFQYLRMRSWSKMLGMLWTCV